MAKELELAIRIAGRLDGTLTSAVSQAQAMILRMANTNVSTTNRIAAGARLATNVGNTILKTVGAGTAAAFTAATVQAGKLNKEVANIGTLSVGSERQQQIKKDIQEIAIEVGKNTSDIADGTYQVISAYGDAADTMDKVKINAKAARAGLSTTNDSIALTSAVTKAYGDTSAAATQHIADLAFKTVELGQTTFPELASSMGKVASMSTNLGVSQEELFASYATLTGVTGDAAQVQTQMMAIYNALLKPNKAMTATIEGLGYESGYTMIKTLGLAGTLQALKTATGGSSEKLLELYSNQRAMPAILALTGAQAEVFTTKLEKMKNVSGATDKAFETQTRGISKTGFTLDQAKVKMQVAAQRFGDSIAPMVGKFADVVGGASDALANMSDESRENIATAALWTTGVGAALVVGGRLTTSVTQIVQFARRLGAVAPAIAPVVKGIGSIASFATPILGTAAALAATAGVIELVDKKFNYVQLFHNRVEKLGAATAELSKYNKLAVEVAQQKEILSNPQSSTEQLDAAKTRLEEIAQMLGEDYSFEINCDTSALDAAISKQQMLSREDMLDAADDVNGKLKKSGKNYKSDVETVDRLDAEEPGLRNNVGKYGYYSNEAQRAIREYERDKGKDEVAAKEAYVRKINELYQNARLDGIQYDQYTDIGNEMAANEIANRFQGSSDTAQINYEYNRSARDRSYNRKTQVENDVNKAASYYAETLANDTQNGRSYERDTVISKFQELGENAREIGVNTAELATQFSAAAVGYTDFSAAIADGKVGEMTNQFIEFNHDIGETAQNTVQGAALIANGFTDAQQAVAAGGDAINNVLNDLMRFGEQEGLFKDLDTSGIIGKINEMASAIGLLPEGKSITIDANGNFALIDEATQAVETLDGKNANVTVNANGDTSEIDEAAQAVAAIDGENANVTVNANGNTAGVEEAAQAIQSLDGATANATVDAQDNATPVVTGVQNSMNTLNSTTVNPVISASDQASGVIQSVSAQLDNLNGKTATTTVITEYKTVGTPPGESATGQRSWRGGLTYVNDQNVQDPREVIEHDGMRYWFSGRNVLANVPRGARIYNASESRSIINGSHRGGLNRVPFDGYIAELHSGERVLTEREAEDFDGEYGRLGDMLSTLRNILQSDGRHSSGGGMQITYSPVVTITGGADNTSIERTLRDDYERFKSFFERMKRENARTRFG